MKTIVSTLVAQRLLAPLGMKDTTFRPSAEQLQRLASRQSE
jgi:CubicO group peptidase (beta-lactamase class C family)